MHMQGIRMKSPGHPGGFLNAEILAPLGLSMTDAAAALGVTRAALSDFLDERGSLPGEMAVRIEKAFGISIETLMRMQCSFDIAQAKARVDDIIVERFVQP